MTTPIVVTEAEYIALVAKAYLAAPPTKPEEDHLRRALISACHRLGLDHRTLIEELIREAPIQRAAEAEVASG